MDHILIDGRWNSSLFDVEPFRVADFDTDHCLVVTIVREKLDVCKRTMQKCYMDRFYLKKLNKVQGKEQYELKISNRFTGLENLDDYANSNRAWETVRQNINISAKESLGCYELKHKTWCDEGCSELLDQRKQAKLQWLQDHSQIMKQ
jgi:hypothetical protein